jgi:hypothetical protein
MVRYVWVVVGISVCILLTFFVIGPTLSRVTYVPASSESPSEEFIELVTVDVVSSLPSFAEEEKDSREQIFHVPLPDAVRAIYMTACVAGTPSFRHSLVQLIEETEINSVMIDIKDFSGTISFPPQSPVLQPAWQASSCGARDMKDFIADLHQRGIFVIGRITVFQDPFYAEKNPDVAVLRSNRTTVWKDHKGLAFVDVAAQSYWDYIIELAIESYNIGFDELNFDYVRYPSDGNMADAVYPHTEKSSWPHHRPSNLEAFFEYLAHAMTDENKFSSVRHEDTGREKTIPWTSVDLFGMTTTNYDDLSIGQIQERAAPYFDVVAPMVYPSHYPPNYLGLGNPNDNAYAIVHHAMRSAVARMTATTTPLDGFMHERIGTTTPALYTKPAFSAANLRTWIQDFNYGGVYDAPKIREQIQASYDAGVMSWMIWSPSNRYTRGALLPNQSSD